MRILKIIFMLLGVMVIFGCVEEVQPPEVVQEPIPEPVVVEEVIVPEPEIVTCNVNADCQNNLLCIDDECRTLASLFSYDCETKCNYAEAEITTSDGQDFTIKRGQGSYTLAGAIEWQLISIPDYCASDNFIVPIKLLKKSSGKVLSEEIRTVKVGQESKIINHPNMPGSEFTLTVRAVDDTC